MGVFGHPRACAMGFGMAITSGVSMNGCDGGAMSACPVPRRFWFRIAAQALDAGDHTTGRGPFAAVLGQACASSCVAAPEALLSTRTNAQPPRLAAGEA